MWSCLVWRQELLTNRAYALSPYALTCTLRQTYFFRMKSPLAKGGPRISRSRNSYYVNSYCVKGACEFRMQLVAAGPYIVSFRPGPIPMVFKHASSWSQDVEAPDYTRWSWGAWKARLIRNHLLRSKYHANRCLKQTMKAWNKPA